MYVLVDKYDINEYEEIEIILLFMYRYYRKLENIKIDKENYFNLYIFTIPSVVV